MTTRRRTARPVTGPDTNVTSTRPRLIVMLLAGLAAVLLPSVSAFAQMWQTVTASSQVAASETAGGAAHSAPSHPSSALVDVDPVAAKLVAVDVFDVADIMVQAGRLVALIRSQPAQPSAVAVARDRIDKAATNVGDGLELAGDVNNGPGDVDLLNQVDGLTAAVLAMTKASAGADLSSAAPRATIDTTPPQ